MDILILFAWQDAPKGTQSFSVTSQWANALTNELNRYKYVTAKNDLQVLNGSSRRYDYLKQEILDTRLKILVVLSIEYIQNVKNQKGIAHIENLALSQRIAEHGLGNDVLFIKKDRSVVSPYGLLEHNIEIVDYSWINESSFNLYTVEEQKKSFDAIISFFDGLSANIPVYKTSIQSYESSKQPITFETLFPSDEQVRSTEYQEKRLLSYIRERCDDASFLTQYIKSGPASDECLFGRMTPELFYKHFYIPRKAEQEFNRLVDSLFHSPNHNMLCVRAGRGSGKSTFLNMLSLRGTQQTHYTPVFVDLAQTSNYSKGKNKEAILYQVVRKWYRRMCNSASDEAFQKEWRDSFVREASRYSTLTDDIIDSTFLSMIKFMFASVIPEDADRDNHVEKEREWYDSLWKKGYSARFMESVLGSTNYSARVGEESTFFLLMIFLLTILNAIPTRTTENRFLIVFDNLESFDNGERASSIIEFATNCHKEIHKVFDELNRADVFFLKFTFVLSIRTSTFGFIGNRQSQWIWDYGRNAIDLKYEDFSVESLLKKLLYLKQNRLAKSKLYSRLYTLLELLLPRRVIANSLNKKEYTSDEDLENPEKERNEELAIRHFASDRLLPLYNNDFRRAMDSVCAAIFNRDDCDKIVDYIHTAQCAPAITYSNDIYGARMIIMRSIFDDLNYSGCFEEVGFRKLPVNNDEPTSITRSLLSYLYWHQVIHLSQAERGKYSGISLLNLMDTFKHFIDSTNSKENFSSILFALSNFAVSNENFFRTATTWANLISFYYKKRITGNYVLTFSTLSSAINDCIYGKQSFDAQEIFVRLSDAGICFVRYYMDSYEFLCARMRGSYVNALFCMETEGEITDQLGKMYQVLLTCVHKLLGSCEETCNLYQEGTQHSCFFDELGELDSRKGIVKAMLSCSLFIRCQECSEMIRKAINYIDQFRVHHFSLYKDQRTNAQILSYLGEYYRLYKEIDKQLTAVSYKKTDQFMRFVETWNNPLRLNEASKRFCSSITGSYRIIRPGYVSCDEDFQAAIEWAKASPADTLYEIIKEKIEGKSSV